MFRKIFNLFVFYLILSHTTGSHLFAQKVIQVKSISNDTIKAGKLMVEAKSLLDSAHYSKALLLNRKALNIYLETLGSDTITASAYYLESRIYYKKRNLDSTLHYASKTIDICRKSKTTHSSVLGKAYHLAGNCWLSRGRTGKAISNFEKAIAAKIKFYGKNHSSVAKSFENLGYAFHYQADYDKALSIFDTVLSIKGVCFGENNPNIGLTHNLIGNTWRRKGNYDKALWHYQVALEKKIEKYGENHIKVAYVLNNLGLVMQRKGEYKKAFDNYNRSLKIKIANQNEEDAGVGDTYNNLGLAWRSQGNYKEALKSYQKALEIKIRTRGEKDPSVANTYNNLGILWKSKGNYDKSMFYYKKALMIERAIFRETHPRIANTYNNMGVVNKLIGDYSRAIHFFSKSLEIRQHTLGEVHPSTADSYINIGGVYREMGELEHAISYYQKGLKIELKTLGKDHPGVSVTYINIGVAWEDLGNYPKAMKYYEKALEIQLENLDSEHPILAKTYNNIGIVFQKMENNDQAIESWKKAYEVLRYNPQAPYSFNDVMNIDKLQSTLSAIRTLYADRYKNSKEKKDFDVLWEHFQTMLALEEYIQKENAGRAIRKQFTAKSLSTFEGAIDHLLDDMNHDRLPEIFKLFEKTKSRQLAEKIQAEPYTTSFGIPDSLRELEHDLNVDISYYEKKEFQEEYETEAPNDSLLSVYQSKVFDLRNQRDELLATFKNEYTDYYNLRYSLKVLDVEKVQNEVLTDEQTLLEYFVGDSSLYLFLLQPNTYLVKEVKKDFPLDSLVENMRQGLYSYYRTPGHERSDAQLGKLTQQYVAASRQLYQKLIAPVADQLTESVIIVPDGVLGYVPFEALLSEKVQDLRNFSTYPYLLKDHNISYTYSATLLKEMQDKQHRKEPKESLLAFAPFYEEGYEHVQDLIAGKVLLHSVDTSGTIALKNSFNPLPNSGVEAATVATAWNGDYYLGEDATETTFNEEAGDYRILHLSTHGVADYRVGDYSYLAFAEIPDSIENELLYVRDLYNLQLNADLVVLSACETGIGELQRGEGIISLARAFAYAGAKSILTTLWVADDAATKDLMIDFYRLLKAGKSKDEALRQAKLSYLEGDGAAMKKHPFFWASFVGVGDMRAID